MLQHVVVAPLVPYLYDRLQSILSSLMSRILKKSVMESISSGVDLVKIDVNKESNCRLVKEIDIGFGTRRALTKVPLEVSVAFRKQARDILQRIIGKLQE